MYIIKPVAENACRVTMVQEADYKGDIPLTSSVKNYVMRSQLKMCRSMQLKFERSVCVVDAEIRNNTPPPPPVGDLTGSEREVYERVMALEDQDPTGIDWEIHVSQQPVQRSATSRLNEMAVKTQISSGIASAEGWHEIASSEPYVNKWWKVHEMEDGPPITLFKSRTSLDCAAVTASTFWFTFMSRQAVKEAELSGDPARMTIEEITPHDHSRCRVVSATATTGTRPL
jgi:hypothetical protein